ncbi:MAG: M1 family aminopeptidase [Vicinamibacterales bacterium]
MSNGFLSTGAAVASSLACVAALAAQPRMPGPGIPLDLATERAGAVRDLKYELSLTVPKAQAAPLTGTMTARFRVVDGSRRIAFDFAPGETHVKAVRVNGEAVTPTFVTDHFIVPVRTGRNADMEVAIDFVAGDASLNRNPDFLYALFVPARAHLAIPVFDQPDLKARWTLRLTYPGAWVAVSNGQARPEQIVTISDVSPVVDAVGATTPLADGDVSTHTVTFAETEPLPTYLFSFVVGDFKVVEGARNGRTFHFYHRETDAAKVARNVEALFDLHDRAIRFMEDYTGIPYAFGKFDFVAIPAFQFGGMEHAGKILYNASSLLLDESATQNQYLGRASVISHETAHMWFGDLVTMRWFNDVWMKEVFANFMAAKIVNPSFPDVNHELRFLYAHYPAAYEVDRTAGANPIRQPLENLNEAGSLYGAIIYQKAPVMMRHLEALLGETSFRDGLREYLGAHRFGNATWTDLIEVLDRRTPADLAAWSTVWVESPGRPTVTTELTVKDGRIASLAFSQTDSWKRGRVWPQTLKVTLALPDGSRTIDVALTGPRTVVKEAAGWPAPAYILPNGNGWAYGGFVLDATSRDYLAAHIADVPDVLTRGAAWVTLWDALLDRAVPATRFVDTALAAVAVEPDEQSRSRILGYLTNAWWRFLPAAERTSRAASAEATLRKGLEHATTASQKSAWFGAVRRIGATPGTLAWLTRVWEKTETVEGLPLAEADYSTLALELAVRDVPRAQEILDTQLGRIENPDRKARFAFVMPALSGDPAVRERWFLSLKDVANRRREPWVLEGLDYLHHPLRAAQSARYVRPSLEMLWEIQKTGDIFFPKRWMDTTLGGYSSADTAGDVRRFLATLPKDYPPRLRNVILSSADELFRAAGQ